MDHQGDRPANALPSAVILFDTTCALCCGMTSFILAHEREPFFSFASAWSPVGLELAAAHGFSAGDLDETFLVILGDRACHRSDAGIEILRRLRAPWSLASAIRWIPRGLRDPVYGALARRRKAWFGEQSCFMPAPEQAHRFLDLSGTRAAQSQ